MAKPKLIRSVLESTLKGLEIDLPLRAYSIWGAWAELVGNPIASQTKPRVIRNRILFLDVSHPTWVQQLQFLKPTLLRKINTFIGEDFIEDVRFRVAKIPAPTAASATSLRSPHAHLPEETLKRIEGLLQGIADGEVRKVLGRILVKGAELEQARKGRKQVK